MNNTKRKTNSKTKPKKIKFRFILVEPEGPMNIGAVARVLKNFGVKQMHMINPKCEIDKNAFMFAKHAKDLLKKAKIHKDLKCATKGCSYIVGTTGMVWRFRKTFRIPISLREFKEYKHMKGEIAILFGREGTGLTEKENDFCDFLITIPTSKNYPVMNLSHAVSIVAYELSDLKYKTPKRAVNASEKRKLLEAFNMIVDYYAWDMRNPEKVKIGFKRMIGRAFISSKEAVSVLSVLRRANRELKKKKQKKK